MPLKLNVGVSRKIGLPEYSSAGASCHLEVELDSGSLDDLDGFHCRVRDVFVAAQQAVNDELARLQGQPVSPLAPAAATLNGNGHHNGVSTPTSGATERPGATAARAGGARARPARPATTSQVKAIHAIARAQRADLEGLLRDEYGVDRPDELSLADASKFIDQLRATASL